MHLTANRNDLAVFDRTEDDFTSLDGYLYGT